MALESIALIPSGVKATKVYSQLPVNGNGDFTFDRGTSTDQTRVNKNGLIESVAQDVPRLDYLDGGCPSLLLEPASTNLITYSEDFSNAAWTKIGISVSADSTTSLDGNVTADKIIESATLSLQTLYNETSVTTGTKYTLSIFVKKNERRWFFLRFGSAYSAFVNAYAWFDLENGLLGSKESGIDDYSIENYGNGWYKLTATATSTATATGRLFYGIATDDGIKSYTGDGTSGVYIFGAQLEQKSYATSYIPTSGATATRAAETCNGAGTTDEINSQEGVLFFEGRAIADDLTDRRITLSDGTFNNRVILLYASAVSNRIALIVIVGGATVCNINVDTLDITTLQKIAIKYKQDDFKLYLNGILVALDNLGGIFSSNILSNLAFTDADGSSSPFYGRVKKLSVYDSALTDSQLETLTGFGSFSEMKSYLSYS